MKGTFAQVLGGPAREGLCLLQSMLLFGRCGRRLSVRYIGNGGVYPLYECNWRHHEAVARHARLTLPAKPLDVAIAERLLAAVTPLTIKLVLKALTSEQLPEAVDRVNKHGTRPQAPAAVVDQRHHRRERAGAEAYDWIDKGVVTAHRRKPGLPYAITITDEIDRKLTTWCQLHAHCSSSQRELSKVQYEACVGVPSGCSPPSSAPTGLASPPAPRCSMSGAPPLDYAT